MLTLNNGMTQHASIASSPCPICNNIIMEKYIIYESLKTLQNINNVYLGNHTDDIVLKTRKEHPSLIDRLKSCTEMHDKEIEGLNQLSLILNNFRFECTEDFSIRSPDFNNWIVNFWIEKLEKFNLKKEYTLQEFNELNKLSLTYKYVLNDIICYPNKYTPFSNLDNNMKIIADMLKNCFTNYEIIGCLKSCPENNRKFFLERNKVMPWLESLKNKEVLLPNEIQMIKKIKDEYQKVKINLTQCPNNHEHLINGLIKFETEFNMR